MRAYMAFEDDYHHASTSGMVGLQGRETSGTNSLHRTIRCSTQGHKDEEDLVLHPGTYDVLLLLQDLREELLKWFLIGRSMAIEKVFSTW